MPMRLAARLSVRLKRSFRLMIFNKKEIKVLEIGGGRRPVIETGLNIDTLDAPEVDLLHVFPVPLPFGESVIDRIVTIAMLEHFNIREFRTIVGDFNRVLVPGGKLEISIPALDKIFHKFQEEGCTDKVLRYLHGAQRTETDIHLAVLSTERICHELRELNFDHVREVVYDYPLHDKEYMVKIVGSKPRGE